MTDPDNPSIVISTDTFQEGRTYAVMVGLSAVDGYKFVYGLDEPNPTKVDINGAILGDSEIIFMDDTALVGYTFAPLSEKYLLGDVNGDEEVDIADATLIQRSIAQMNTSIQSRRLMYGDVIDTGELDLLDVTAIQYYLANIQTDFKVGKTIWKNR